MWIGILMAALVVAPTVFRILRLGNNVVKIANKKASDVQSVSDARRAARKAYNESTSDEVQQAGRLASDEATSDDEARQAGRQAHAEAMKNGQGMFAARKAGRAAYQARIRHWIEIGD